MRDVAKEIFAVACRAADPGDALRAALHAHPIAAPQGRLLLVALGKAAVAMTEAFLMLHLADAAIVITNDENARPVSGARVLASGHPVPDARGEAAGRAVTEMLRSAAAEDRVVVLVSGGGSALLPAPVQGVSLADKQALNRVLLAGGLSINEMNLVRQQVSSLKGGGMLRLAAPAPVQAYILSDVIGDDLRVIASGPTVAPVGTSAQAQQLLQQRGLWTQLPLSIQTAIAAQHSAPASLPAAENLLIGSNRKSLEAMERAATAAGFNARIISDHLTGDVADAAQEIIRAASEPHARPTALIFGGETAVTLRGNGLGGRNQELALRVAKAMPAGDWVFLSGGTDGRDGPTDDAGGLVDAGTWARIGDTAEALLANNDSNAALRRAGDLLTCGPTGTNVADVQIMLLA